MAQRLRRALAAFLWLQAACWAAPAARAQEPAGPLEVRFLNVGQSDAILVRCPDGEHYLLIDSGDTRYPGSQQAFRNALTAEFAGKPQPWRIALVIASHPHTDHIGSLQWLLEHPSFEVDTYVDNGQTFDTATWARLEQVRRRLVSEGRLNYISGREAPFAELELCPNHGVRVHLLVPWAVHSLSDPNDRSVVVRLEYGETSFLFTGDAETHAEDVLLNEIDEEQRRKLDVDVLKAGHHGSDTSSGAGFIQAASPVVIVVSSGQKEVGTNVRYKHPRLSTLRSYADWFRNRDAQAHPLDGRVWAYDAQAKSWRQHTRRLGLWVTPKDGAVTIRSDGHTLEIQTEENGVPVTITPP